MVIIICGKNGAGLSLTGINFELAIKDLDHCGFFCSFFIYYLVLFPSVAFSRSAPFISGKNFHFFMSLRKKLTFIGDFEIFV